MKRIILAAWLLAAPAFASQNLLQLSSDQSTYAVNAVAHLDAVTLVTPLAPTDDFYIGASLNGTPIPVIETNNGRGISLAGPLQSGNYVWTVQLYLEDKTFAAQLNRAITSLTLANDHIATEISQTTDPTQIVALQAQEAQNQSVINEANNELNNIRTPFGASQSLAFVAQ